jgi:hypothetical protein
MGIYDKTIELLETLSPFSCVFLALHLHAVTNRNMEMASDDLPFSIAVFLFLFVIFMYWVVSGGKKKNTKVKRDAEGREEKRFTPRSDTLDGS